MAQVAAVEDGLDDAAQGEETQVGNPQAVVAPCLGGNPVDDKEQRPGDECRDEHAHRAREADEHAVPHECRHAGGGYQRAPHAVIHGGLDDALLVGQQPEGQPRERINQGEDGSHAQSPQEQQAHATPHARHVAHAVVLAHNGLTGKGDAVHEVTVEGEQLQNQGINGKDEVAAAGTDRDKCQADGHQQETAHKDVAAHLEVAPGALETPHSAPVEQTVQARELALHGQGGIEQSQPLARQRAHGDTRKAHLQQIDADEARRDVKNVGHDGDPHRALGVLHTQQPPLEGHHHQHGRNTPDADGEIGDSQRSNLGRGPDNPQQQQPDGPLQHDDEGRDDDGQRRGLAQQLGALVEVAAAARLCRHARCAHAQEPEIPIHQVEHHRAHSHSTDKDLIAQVPRDGGIHQAQQRHGDVGYNRRQRNPQYLPIHAREGTQKYPSSQ